MKKELFVIPEVSVEGGVEAIKQDEGYLLKVKAEGGSVFIKGDTGRVGQVEWSKDKVIILPIKYDAFHSFYFHLNLYGADGSFVEADFGTQPFVEAQVAFPLTFLDLETVFMPRTPGRLKNMMHGTPQKAEDIVMIEFFIPESLTASEIYLRTPYLSDEVPSELPKASAQLDTLGQWKVKDWKGKTKDKEELISNLRKIYEESLPKNNERQSQFGGELSMKREGTGFFRVHQEDGRYWFCDPQGYLMFASGIDLIEPGGFSPVTGIEALFEDLPPKEGVYAAAWDGDHVSHHIANLIRAFGQDWHEAWKYITSKRIRSWGFSGVGNWSSDYAIGQEIAYFLQKPFPVTKKTLFRSMPDVFSKEYAHNSKECAKALEATKDDPYLVGYFLRNEPDWAFGTYNMAGIMLEKDEDFASKEVFIKKMEKQYQNIDAFNKAWCIRLSSFEDLKQTIEKPWLLSKESEEDLQEFTRDIIREYIRVPSLAYKEVDPNHLNLGLRWGWLENEDLTLGSEFFDVFSINHYKEEPEADLFELINKLTGLPVLIGEYQVGSLDVGLASNGMFGVTSQDERGVFYQYYMEKAAAIPYLVGAHYFQWNDQPTLGRFDGENLNIGVVDVCNRPYEDCVNRMRETHTRLGKVHAGIIEPTKRRSQRVPKEGF